jgi:DNA primase
VSTSDGKSEVLREIIPLIQALPEEVKREEKALDVAGELGIREDTVVELLNRDVDSDTSGGSSLTDRIKGQSGTTIEEFFFRCLGDKPEAFGEVMEVVALKDFSDARSKKLMEGLRQIERSEDDFSVDRWMDELDDDLVSYLAGILNREETQEAAERIEPIQVARKLKSDSARRERARLHQALREEDENTGAGELDEAKKSLLKQTMEMKQQEDEYDD